MTVVFHVLYIMLGGIINSVVRGISMVYQDVLGYQVDKDWDMTIKMCWRGKGGWEKGG